MPYTFRDNTTRGGLAQDNTCNFALRVYYFRNNGGLKKPALNHIDVLKIIFAISRSFDELTKNNTANNYPNRIQINYKKEDIFMSVVLGFQFNTSITKQLDIANLRFAIPYYVNKLNEQYLYCTNYHCYDPVATWDGKHIKEDLYIDISGNDCKKAYELALSNVETYIKDNNIDIGYAIRNPNLNVSDNLANPWNFEEDENKEDANKEDASKEVSKEDAVETKKNTKKAEKGGAV